MRLPGAALICLRVTAAAWGLARDFLARVRTGSAVDTTKSPRRGLLLLLGWAAAWIVLLVLIAKIVSSAAGAFTGTERMSSGAALLVAPAALLLPTIFALWRQKRIEDFTLQAGPPSRVVVPAGEIRVRIYEREQVFEERQVTAQVGRTEAIRMNGAK